MREGEETYPTAALISLWFSNFVLVKWFTTHPQHENSTKKIYDDHQQKHTPFSTPPSQILKPKEKREVLTISFLFHGAWFLRLKKKLYIGTVKNAHHKLGVCRYHGAPSGWLIVHV